MGNSIYGTGWCVDVCVKVSICTQAWLNRVGTLIGDTAFVAMPHDLWQDFRKAKNQSLNLTL